MSVVSVVRIDAKPTGKIVSKEIISDLKKLSLVVSYIQSVVPDDAIIFLTGDLAAGKTTLAKSIVDAEGFAGVVSSPTFSLQHCYSDKLFHYDLYRIDFEQFVSLGLFEEFDRAGWHLVEWGSDELKSTLVSYGYDCYEVSIIPSADEVNRIYTIGKLDA